MQSPKNIPAENIKDPKSVLVRVAYPWGEDTKQHIISKDNIWKFIKSILEKSCGALNKAQANKKLAPVTCRFSRMRALHGSDLLGTFIHRCKEADILIFDITKHNPNVMLELGIALGLRQGPDGCIFILQQVDDDKQPTCKIPSDLTGYFFTFYKRNSNEIYSLTDERGFAAALLARIKDQARNKGYIVDKQIFQTDEDE